ncbi:MAG: antitoxin Xre/MbcA/ParS toxin-binding domain-containing protein [Massilia sp.]
MNSPSTKPDSLNKRPARVRRASVGSRPVPATGSTVIAQTVASPATQGAGAPMTFQGAAGEIIKKMRSGTPARNVIDIASNLGVSQDTLFELLRLPRNTLKGRIKSDGVLSATEQDRVYRAEKVLERALGVLEGESAARNWLSQKNRSLGGESPLALLDTEAGYELVLDTLGRIEFGVIS